MDESAGQHRQKLLVVLDHVVVLGQLFQHHLARLLLVPELLVADLEQAALFDDTVEVAAMVAGRDLLAEFDNLLAQVFLGQVGNLAGPDFFPVGRSHFRFEQNAAAALADALQHRDDRPGTNK